MLKTYSDKTKQYYNNVEDAKKAELEFDKKQEVASKASEEKKADAEKVESAYKHMLDVSKQADKMITDAENAYYVERKKFISKYGSFHMTYYNDDGNQGIAVSDLVNRIFDLPFNW